MWLQFKQIHKKDFMRETLSTSQVQRFVLEFMIHSYLYSPIFIMPFDSDEIVVCLEEDNEVASKPLQSILHQIHFHLR